MITRKQLEHENRKVEFVSVGDLQPNPHNARTHSAEQIDLIASAIGQFGFINPIIVNRANKVLAGHARLEASKKLGLTRVPVLRVEHLSPAQMRAYVLADNKLAEKADWSTELLKLEIQGLLDLDFDVELTGFSTAEIDLLLGNDDTTEDVDNVFPEAGSEQGAVTRPGDCWQAGEHFLICGDARNEASYRQLMSGKKARYCITDPPYNVRIDGHATGLGRVHHREFAMASGELSRSEFTDLLAIVFRPRLPKAQSQHS
jgi:ParB-like nuclease domain